MADMKPPDNNTNVAANPLQASTLCITTCN